MQRRDPLQRREACSASWKKRAASSGTRGSGLSAVDQVCALDLRA
jgi:hypothetical protein